MSSSTIAAEVGSSEAQGSSSSRPRLVAERASQRQALPLSSRELGDRPVEQCSVETQCAQQTVDAHARRRIGGKCRSRRVGPPSRLCGDIAYAAPPLVGRHLTAFGTVEKDMTTG